MRAAQKPFPAALPKMYRYELSGGWVVLAGKTDADNDQLSTVLAHPQDWWFHVKGMPGSHVLLRAKQSGEEPPPEIIKAAAAIAAYHSKARNASTVFVSCTRARYVTKLRGSPRGTVAVHKEKVVKVQPRLPESH